MIKYEKGENNIFLERVVYLAGQIYDYLFAQYQNSVHKGFKGYKFWSLVLLLSSAFLFFYFLLVVKYSIEPSLKKEVLETRGMVKLIPNEVLRNNKRIQNKILKGKNHSKRDWKMKAKKRRST